jgi:large subunit ribosomal protein L25
MAEITLNLQSRTVTGKGAARKIRRDEKIPGILYFHGQQSISFTVNKKEVYPIIGKESTLLDINIDGKSNRKAIVRETQFDPLTSEPIHIDLMGIDLSEKIHVEVPMVIVGIADGVKNQGGMLEQHIRSISIECLPSDIPENIKIDVTKLVIG